MRGTQSVKFENIDASTAAFTLTGGLYAASVIATFGGGSVKLQHLAADGTTYVSVASATDFTAAGYGTAYLPPGLYRFTIATAIAVYAKLTRVPSE